MRVLKPTGSLFMMNYPKQNAHMRVKFLDDNAFDVQDYVWIYNTNVGHSPRRFTTAHRSILHATKSKNNKFYKDNVAVPYQNPTDKRIQERIAAGHLGRMPYSWFYFDLVKNVSKDKTFHSCCKLPIFRTVLYYNIVFCKKSYKKNRNYPYPKVLYFLSMLMRNNCQKKFLFKINSDIFHGFSFLLFFSFLTSFGMTMFVG